MRHRGPARMREAEWIRGTDLFGRHDTKSLLRLSVAWSNNIRHGCNLADSNEACGKDQGIQKSQVRRVGVDQSMQTTNTTGARNFFPYGKKNRTKQSETPTPTLDGDGEVMDTRFNLPFRHL